MSWSSFHRGEYRQMRRGLTMALLESEAMEPRVQLAYSRGLVPAELTAKMGLVRLLLERADVLVREALDQTIADTGKYYDVYSETRFSDRALAETPSGVVSGLRDGDSTRADPEAARVLGRAQDAIYRPTATNNR